MKKQVLFLFIILPILQTNAQTTVVLQPNSSDGKDASLANCIPCGYLNTNYGSSTDFATAGWTNGGAESDLRALIDFDWSIVPPQSTILNATLSLYHNPSSQNGTHSSLTGSNESVLKRVTGPWSESTVTWANQPNTTSVNEIYVPQSTSSNQNYININVTALVQDIFLNPTTSHGFLFRSIVEDPYRRLIFASSDHPNSKLHPRIEITYRERSITTDSCQTFQPGWELGKDALLANCIPCGYLNTNYGAAEDFASAAWTNSGAESNLRALIDFDLSTIPPNSVLTNAELSLYHNPNSQNGDHSSLSGSNESVLQRVTAAWSENTVTWNNQPTASNVNQVFLAQSSSSNQNYTNIDVTALTQDILNMPTFSHGFLLKSANETAYRRMIFASSDHPNMQLHPKLKVCYSTPVTIEPEGNEISFNLYPNPTSDVLRLVTSGTQVYSLNIYDIRGRLVFNSKFSESTVIDVSDYSAGVYAIKLSDLFKSSVKKLVVQ